MQMVPITEILRKVTGSDDFRDFDGSPETYFMLMVDKLNGRPSVAQLVHEGIKAEDLDPLQILVNADGSWRFGDGHHRFVTGLLRGDDSLPVVHTYHDPASTAHEATSYHEFTESDFSDAKWLADQLGQEYAGLLETDDSDNSDNEDFYDEKDFDDYLDETYEPYEMHVFGENPFTLLFTPAKMLKELDPIAYRTYYSDWSDSMTRKD